MNSPQKNNLAFIAFKLRLIDWQNINICKMSSSRSEKKDGNVSKSYKDLIEQNKSLNAEVRRILDQDRKIFNIGKAIDPLTKSAPIPNHMIYSSRDLEYKVFAPPKFDYIKWQGRLQKTERCFLSWIRENIVGINTTYTSQMQLEIETVYVDHTATNRPFRSIEIMVEHAKLFTANPHSELRRVGSNSQFILEFST